MAKEENAGSQDIGAHVQDYAHFIRLFKVSAAVCLIIGLIWMLIIKAYW
jgi:hypothetical protein